MLSLFDGSPVHGSFSLSSTHLFQFYKNSVGLEVRECRELCKEVMVVVE